MGVQYLMYVLLSNTPLSAAANATVSNVFSTDYDSYWIFFLMKSASNDIRLRFQLASGGTPNSTASSYTRKGWYALSSTWSGYTDATTQWGSVGIARTDTERFSMLQLRGPAQAAYTTGYNVLIYREISGSPSEIVLEENYAMHNVASAFDGFYVFTESSTVTGKILVYGLRRS